MVDGYDVIPVVPELISKLTPEHKGIEIGRSTKFTASQFGGEYGISNQIS